MLRSWLCAGGFLASACAVEPSVSVQPIINGEAASPGQFPAVGALVFDFGGPLTLFCTGTLIAPRVVLTAAHCVDPVLTGLSLEDAARATKAVFLQNDISPGIEAGAISAEVEAIFQNPDFDLSDPDSGNDLGLLLLKEEVAGVAPLSVLFDDPSALLGQRFTAVGFGVDNIDLGTGSGVQRFTDFVLESVAGEFTTYGAAQDTDTGVCFGDSGGPDLIEVEGQTFVFGVHSQVVNTQTCLGGAKAQRTDTQAAFVEEIIALSQVEPPEDEDGGCAVAPAGRGAWAALLGFVVLGWLRRRR